MDKKKTTYKLPTRIKVGKYTKCVKDRIEEYGDLWIADFLDRNEKQCVITFSKRKRLTLSAFRFARVPNGDRVPIAGTDLLMGGQFEPDESGGMSTHRMKQCSSLVLDWSESTRVPYSGNDGNPFGDRGQENFRGLAKEWGEWADSVWGDRSGKPEGPLEHLRREVEELTAAPNDLLEYADVLALTMESGRLAGFSPDDLLWAVREKLEINKAREWGPMDDCGVSSHIKIPELVSDPILNRYGSLLDYLGECGQRHANREEIRTCAKQILAYLEQHRRGIIGKNTLEVQAIASVSVLKLSFPNLKKELEKWESDV